MTLQNTKTWFEAAVPEPDDRARAVQLGCHLEEVVEMLENLIFGDADLESMADNAAFSLTDLSSALKGGIGGAVIIDRTDHLDALADQIVTAVGCAHMEGMDIVGALGEVNRSNWSKFVDGKPVFDENGKIRKGPGYSAPELGRFVGEEGHSMTNANEILQAECEKLRKDAERYRYIKKGNQWIVAATQTGAQLDGEDLDDIIDSEMEQQK